MLPSLCLDFRSFLLRTAALAAALSFATAAVAGEAPSQAPGAAGPELVLLAEPTASDALAPGATGPVTLAYRVLEIFQGEPGAASVIVRHETLTPDDRSRLRDGERVILLARQDAANAGRWTAPAPLRATPSAVAAFRRWSAPEDVRAARPVEAVVAEVARDGGASAPSAAAAAQPAEPHAGSSRAAAPAAETRAASAKPNPAPAPAPAASAPAASAAPAEPESLAEESVAERHEAVARPAAIEAPAPRPAAVVAASPAVTPAASAAPRSAAPAPARVTPAVAASPAPARAADTDWNPPLLFDPKPQPALGPGLPPEPPHGVLGPPLGERTDLKPPSRRGRMGR